MRLISYLGKGGTGKTTIAAATAFETAKRGKRTLLASTSFVYGLRDVVGTDITDTPREIAPKLWAQGNLSAEQEGVLSLLRILRSARKGNYEVVVIDSNAAQQIAYKMTLPSVLSKLDPADADVRKQLMDPEQCSFRVVATPDPLAIQEGQRAVTYLNLFDYPVDSFILNQVLPTEQLSDDVFMGKMQANQAKSILEAHDECAPLPVIEVPAFSDGAVGKDALARLGSVMWEKGDPLAIHRKSKLMQIEQSTLRLPLLFANISDVHVEQQHSMLRIGVGLWQRDLSLENTPIVGRNVTRAILKDGMLEVSFE